jgi:hypothetical protein
MRKLFVASLFVVVVAAPARAQDRPVGINFGGGWAFPMSGIADSFDTGWNGSIGVTFNITPTIGIQSEYMYDRLGGPDKTFNVFPTPSALDASTPGTIESNHQMHTGTFNLVYSPFNTVDGGSSTPVGAYFLGGGGVYHRLIQLTTPSVGYTSICDPYWLTCYPALVEVDRIIGDRSSTDFGINLGAGMTFGTDAKFYIETRWHYVWGPKVTNPPLASQNPQPGVVDCSQGCSTNAQYFPLTFGVRW